MTALPINDLTSAGRRQIEAIIRKASSQTGADFAYLLDKARQESGLDTTAKASTSSATGLYQFIEQTWLTLLKSYGAKHGYAQLAEKIATDTDGKAVVADPTTRAQILNLRKDPQLSALMAGEFARENQQYLQRNTEGEVGKTELYLAHFLGAGGAAKFINALRENPSASGAAMLPAAAKANRSVFYAEGGRPRSVSEIYNRFAAKFDDVPAANTGKAANTGNAYAATVANPPSARALAGESQILPRPLSVARVAAPDESVPENTNFAPAPVSDEGPQEISPYAALILAGADVSSVWGSSQGLGLAARSYQDIAKDAAVASTKKDEAQEEEERRARYNFNKVV